MRLHDNRVTYGIRLSDRIWKDTNGQLICRDCVIARTGTYLYAESDIIENGDPNKIIKVYRDAKEVFDPIAMASFENKPFCDEHPSSDVTVENCKQYKIGYMRDIRRGSGKYANCLICDVVVDDAEAIKKILNNEKRELSLGYDTQIIKDEQGRYVMTQIRGNHLALVEKGRAGCATIRDQANRLYNKSGGRKMAFIKSNKKPKKVETERFLYDEDDIITVEELKDEEIVELSSSSPESSEDIIVDEFPLEEEEVEEVVDEDTVETLNTQMDSLKKRYRMLKAKRDALQLLDAELEEELESVEDEAEEAEEVVEEDAEVVVEDTEDEYNDYEEEVYDEAEEEEEVELLDANKIVKDASKRPLTAVVRTPKASPKATRTYSKFASNLVDSAQERPGSLADSINQAWQKRYDAEANKH